MAEDARVLFDADWLVRSVAGKLLGNPKAEIRSVEVDSRSVRPGSLFVALPGQRVDGHDYISAAIAAGASAVVASEEGWARRALTVAPCAEGRNVAVILARDSLLALQDAARVYRLRFPALLRVGITGSSGKTTTKECLGSILARRYRTFVNPGNLNSEIGLPQALFGLRPEHEVGVFEMGINHAGEMDALVRVWEPSFALITNIGTAHVGILGTRRAIAEEKKRIFSKISASGAAFAWEDDDYLPFLSEGLALPLQTFGPRTLAGFEGANDEGLEGWRIRYMGMEMHFPLPGSHNLLDALGAMALAQALGCGPADMREGLQAVQPIFGRSEIIRGPVTVIQDCYNANPDSVARSLDFCDSLSWEGRRIYVLGSMLELGSSSADEHRAMGHRAGSSRAAALFFFGAETAGAAEEARAAGFRGFLAHTNDFDELTRLVRDRVRDGDLWLIKASRGMALERLTDSVRRG